MKNKYQIALDLKDIGAKGSGTLSTFKENTQFYGNLFYHNQIVTPP